MCQVSPLCKSVNVGSGISCCSQRGYEATDFFRSTPLNLWERSFQLGGVSKLFISGLACSLFVVRITQAIPLGQLVVQLFLKKFCAQLSSVSFPLLRRLLTLPSGFSISLYADRVQI